MGVATYTNLGIATMNESLRVATTSIHPGHVAT